MLPNYYEIIKGKLKDSMGKIRTVSLFLEPAYNDTDEAVFTLKDQDYTYKDKFYYSLKQIYLEIADPTEYQFAISVFNSWDQWKRMVGNKTLEPYISAWREELEIKLRSMGINNIIEVSKTSDVKALQAMKWVAEGSWKVAKRGRISKEDKASEVRKEAGILRSITEDLQRISNV